MGPMYTMGDDVKATESIYCTVWFHVGQKYKQDYKTNFQSRLPEHSTYYPIPTTLLLLLTHLLSHYYHTTFNPTPFEQHPIHSPPHPPTTHQSILTPSHYPTCNCPSLD